jgi:hypothetical protein
LGDISVGYYGKNGTLIMGFSMHDEEGIDRRFDEIPFHSQAHSLFAGERLRRCCSYVRQNVAETVGCVPRSGERGYKAMNTP